MSGSRLKHRDLFLSPSTDRSRGVGGRIKNSPVLVSKSASADLKAKAGHYIKRICRQSTAKRAKYSFLFYATINTP
ncbi:hypothetical protein A3F86_03235 [candidate division WOR-1 bacterium RIFCSPLOWO2_12_FULL_45_9]|uniref:Uncharacterized protein n=1 Tax=candidate division WOR-1 bacterium RIFCSPLOWO2_12_FULL_45_9 TaxID=1802568 RepID=A0A1F4RI85_UNCSA|nr:MAG: hypothetical protein A3F86_03235 [candidate division WOR-1 bacterium RIFCSPLOWO2_12_FULL_45_9]